MNMSSLERFVETLRWRQTDRRCCLPLVLGYAAKAAGVKVKDYVSDAGALVYSQLFAQRCFGYDAVFIYGGNAVEAESMGALLVYPEDDYPYVDPEYRPESLDSLLKRPLSDPARHGRMPQLLRAAGILRQEVGERVPVVGVVVGPFTIAAQMLGLEQMLFLLADDPEKIQELLSYIAVLSRDFALALLAAGSQVIILMDPVSSQSIITPGIFRDLALPLIKRIFAGCKNVGALACWLVITGKTGDLLATYPWAGADLATVDYEVSLENAFHLLPQLVVTGNLKPFSFVERHPGEIKAEARRLLDLAHLRPGYILGTGCELPLNSKQENLEAMMDVL